MSLKSLIKSAKHAYEEKGLDCGNSLLPPATSAEITVAGKSIKLPIPRELRELYKVHGGQEYVPPGVTGLFGQHRLHTLEELVEHYEMFSENCILDNPPKFPPPDDEWGYWVPELIPFASWDAYDLCIHATREDVWEFIPNSGLIRHRPSIASVLEEVIEAVHTGGEPQLTRMRREQVR